MEPHKTRARTTRKAAEMLAIQALAFISEDPRALGRFLDISGIPAGQIRTASREPGFLAGVLEHMLSDEKLLVAFADSAGIDPGSVARAAGMLGGQWERDIP
jgi:Protein of unknown function (DUF3572)